MTRFDDSPHIREVDDPLDPQDPGQGMSALERTANLVVAALLVAFGLYACFRSY